MISKFSKVKYTLCYVLLFTYYSGVLFGTGKGDVCTEDMGPFDDQCQTKCDAKHDGARGALDGPTGACRCYYDCPAAKRCNGGLGMCSMACNDDCCRQKCAGKYPDQKADGTCYNPIGAARFSACLCTFLCKPRQ